MKIYRLALFFRHLWAQGVIQAARGSSCVSKNMYEVGMIHSILYLEKKNTFEQIILKIKLKIVNKSYYLFVIS